MPGMPEVLGVERQEQVAVSRREDDRPARPQDRAGRGERRDASMRPSATRLAT
jgi:hypothetical protein